MKRRIWSVIAVMLLIFNTTAYAADDPPQADNPPRTENLASVVKLNFYRDSGGYGNICVGTLLNDDIVITASHCILDKWATAPDKTLEVQYGKEFSQTAGLYKGEGRAWIKFDPETDLALIRIDTSVTGQADAAPATLVDACSTVPVLDGPVTGIAYRRMKALHTSLPTAEHNTSTIAFSRTGNSALANGKSYISDNGPHAVGGDSGGGVFSEDGILFGVFNGTSGKHDYVSALCVYADRIRAESEALGSPVP